MSDKFKGSIAQVNVQYPIETVINPIAGAQYSRAIIYINVANAADYLPGLSASERAAGKVVELTSAAYGEICGARLKNWLVPFFTKAQTATVYVAIFDEDGESTTATAPLDTVYEATKMLAYFKFGCEESTDYNALQVSLSNLCKADSLYSTLWVGTSDEGVLAGTSTLLTALTGAGSNARVIYNADTNINPALAQLGASLSVANATGTPVGNSMDMYAFNTIGASGAADAEGNSTNLSQTQKSSLDSQKVGYNTYVGDGTENVVTEGSLNLKGESEGANWVKHYIEYMCKVETANLITRLNKFRNNETYQAILLIVTNQARPFVDFGRLANFQITAPIYRDLPASGDQITVPNAWQADYIDNVRQTTVYGTLYITQPTR